MKVKAREAMIQNFKHPFPDRSAFNTKQGTQICNAAAMPQLRDSDKDFFLMGVGQGPPGGQAKARSEVGAGPVGGLS